MTAAPLVDGSSLGRDEERDGPDAVLRSAIPRLLARAEGLTRNSDDAWDLVQKTLERALEAQLPVSEPPRLVGWLCTVLYRLFIDEVRDRRRSAIMCRELTESIDVSGPAPDDVVVDAFEPEDVGPLIQMLEPELRSALVLRVAHNRSLREIAEELKISPATAGTRLFRARRKLRKLLKPRP